MASTTSSPVIKAVKGGPRGSLGIVFIEGVTSGRLAILTLTDGGPAAKDGTLKEGDLVYAVDGQVVLGRSLEELREIVQGPPGTECRLTMDRPSENRQFVVSLRRENMQAREEQKKMEAERLVILETKVVQFESLRVRLESEVARLTQQIVDSRSSYTTQISTLQAQLQSEQANRSRLEQQLALSQASTKNSFENDQLKEEILKLRAELDNTNIRLREMDRLRFELSAKEELEKANQALRERMGSVLTESRNESKFRMEAEAEIKKLNQRLQQAAEQIQAVERRNAEVLTQVHSERASLERERDAALRDVADLRAKNGVLARDLDSQEQHRNRLEGDVHKLQGELHTLRKDHQNLQDRLRTDTERLLGELSTVSAERNTLDRRLREALEELNSTRLALEREKADHHGARDAVNKTAIELSATRSQLDDARRHLDDRAATIRQLEEWGNGLNQKLSEVQAAAVNADSAHKRARMELATVRDELLRLQRELEIATSERDKVVTQTKDALAQMDIRHKRELFELQRSYEQAMENVVKTSVERAAALDIELRSASEALAQKGARERKQANLYAEIISNLQKSKSEVVEADREVRVMMSKYRDRVAPLPFGLNASFDAARLLSTSSISSLRTAIPKGANC